jgi:hypothetical protein
MQVAVFNAEQLRYCAKLPAGLWSDPDGGKHRKQHLYLICFAFDNRFHSDIRLGKKDVCKRVY